MWNLLYTYPFTALCNISKDPSNNNYKQIQVQDDSSQSNNNCVQLQQISHVANDQ